MPNDFNKKELSKNERIIYELAMQVNDMDHRLWSTSSHLLAIGAVLNVDPKKMAEMLTGDDAKIKEYAKKINEEIEKIEKAKAPRKEEAAAEGEHKHDHTGHSHSEHDHEGHDHKHDHQH